MCLTRSTLSMIIGMQVSISKYMAQYKVGFGNFEGGAGIQVTDLVYIYNIRRTGLGAAI